MVPITVILWVLWKPKLHQLILRFFSSHGMLEVQFHIYLLNALNYLYPSSVIVFSNCAFVVLLLLFGGLIEISYLELSLNIVYVLTKK